MSDVNLRALRGSIIGLIVLVAILFLCAGTFAYWQGWVFLAVFVAVSTPVTIYLAIHDPRLMDRRMKFGPVAEKAPAQRIIAALLFLVVAGIVVLAPLDHRFGWSDVPPLVSVVGDALIAASYGIFFFVFRENSYGAASIQLAEGQAVITTGPYAIVRHPMYIGTIVFALGIPLALGSWWGLVPVVLLLPVLAWRIFDEERFLALNLPGYARYMSRVRWRLAPGVF